MDKKRKLYGLFACLFTIMVCAWLKAPTEVTNAVMILGSIYMGANMGEHYAKRPNGTSQVPSS